MADLYIDNARVTYLEGRGAVLALSIALNERDL